MILSEKLKMFFVGARQVRLAVAILKIAKGARRQQLVRVLGES
jgi:hypothetical protein